MEQEGGASGKSVIDHYAREVLVGYAFRGDRPSGSKEIRATPMAAAAEVGNVRLASGPWIADFLDEIAMFPQPGVHDCEVPSEVVSDWRRAESMGQFYNANVKGRFDCRLLRVPPYKN